MANLPFAFFLEKIYILQTEVNFPYYTVYLRYQRLHSLVWKKKQENVYNSLLHFMNVHGMFM